MLIKIKNWREHQHFKDRNPPWIKLQKKLLDDPDWHDLDGKTAKVLMMLWLIASEDKTMEGCLPDIRTISFRLRMSEDETRKQMLKLKQWLEIDDITMISERYQVDAPETEAYREETYSKETEAQSVANEDFEDFWQRWKPYEMTKGSKQDATKAYTKARKETDHETLIRTSAQYAENCRAIRCKTKHAASWLNGRGWEQDDALGALTQPERGGHGAGGTSNQPSAVAIALADRTHR